MHPVIGSQLSGREEVVSAVMCEGVNAMPACNADLLTSLCRGLLSPLCNSGKDDKIHYANINFKRFFPHFQDHKP